MYVTYAEPPELITQTPGLNENQVKNHCLRAKYKENNTARRQSNTVS